MQLAKSISGRWQVLDSLRGIAATVVVVHHFMVFYGAPVKGELPYWMFDAMQWISDRNMDAVLLFFVLSGLCIAIAHRQSDFTQPGELGNYTKRRFWRLVPTYLIALVFTVICGLLVSPSMSFSWLELAGNLLLLQSPRTLPHWVAPFGGNDVLWTLSYEVFFYAIFPVLWIARLRLARWRSWEPSFFILLVLAIAAIAFTKYVFVVPWIMFLTLAPVWYAGYLLGINLLESRPQNWLMGIWLVLASISVLVGLPATPTVLFRGLGIAAILWLVFQIFPRLIELKLNRLLHWLGLGSFLIYILHYPLLKVMHSHQLQWQSTLLVLLIFVLVCPIFEQKLVQFGRRQSAKTG